MASVLVVDDAAGNLRLLESLLAPEGHIVRRAGDGAEAVREEQTDLVLMDVMITLSEASSGKEALERLTLGPAPDLLITDLRMPETDGAELAQHARALETDMKVLYLTSSSDGLFKAFDREFPRGLASSSPMS